MKNLKTIAWTLGLALLTPMTALAEGSVNGDPMSLSQMEMIWATVLFILFAGILGFVVWPKILGALQAREQKLEGDLVGAEQARKDAEAALTEYKAKIAEAQKEAQRVVEEARKAAEQAAAKTLADAQAKIASENQRALAEIEAAKKQALSDVYAQTAELSTAIAGRILKREISAADQMKLVSDSLAELTKAGV